ncbi:MAG: aspartate aminotransferase family protein [Gammaproteobacteria bacterium]|nr:aspartate aminotransferase family protein [Gammaproteobacteria bacterium]MDH4253408.1 aspartate aminotransferase family protein [Gammaproteobacteria bacterium]MDH5309229.1 aspartate aminotransferase family protein [Gammaproteobacteria bacterium]
MTGDVFYRDPTHAYPTGARGAGVCIYDSSGREYLDGSGGAAVSCLGHGNRRVIDAIKAQLDTLAFAHTAFFTSDVQEELASRLARRFPEAGAKVYFVSGGSEANEAAIKLARQYWVARGQEQKTVFVSRMQSYHGNTLGALSLSGNPGRRQLYGPLLHDWPKITACFEYRNRRADETSADYAERCAQELEQVIVKLGSANVAAFVAETVVGATLGAAPAADGYFRRIRDICDRHGVLLILDEVMSGCGRTGTFYAFEQEGILPDIVTMAKGLGGGYQPIGATLARGHIYTAIVEKHGEFAHGHTYVGHPAACAAGVAVQQELDEHGLLDNVREVGGYLRDRLTDALAGNPHVGDIRGRGLFLGVELVVDRATREAPRAELGLAKTIRLAAMTQGLICYPAGGTADGRNGVHVLLAPPFIYTRANADELVERLARTLADLRVT